MEESNIQELREAISRVLNGEKGVRVNEGLGGEYGALAKDLNALLDKFASPSSKPSWHLPENAVRVLDALPMEVVIFDPDLKYQYVNPVAVKDDATRRWMIGKDDFEYCSYRNKDIRIAQERQQLLKDVIRTRIQTPLYQQMKDAEGASKYYLRTVHPVYNAQNELLRLIGCSYEITDLKETEHELLFMNEQLMKTTRELDQFVYRASHDLRSPLVSIMGLVNLIYMEEPSKPVMNYLSMVQRSIVKLDSFIREIVNHSKNSRQELAYELIDPREKVMEAIEELKFLTDGSHFNIEIDVQNTAPWISDPFRTQVVLKNLISNAMKYQKPNSNGDGRIHIAIEIDPEKSRIVVEDNGIGIDPKYHKEVFDMFFRATNQSFGAGIGLYIVKETLNRVNGSIQLESTPDQGSKFTVLLPNHN